jgi:hypothetical protein
MALSAVMTWPLVHNLSRAVAWPGDPFINIWILDWDWYATLHQPLSLFDATAFHPARYSLAYSENLYGVALLLFPLRALGAGPIAAYNIAMLLGYAFSGFAAYLLGQHVSGSRWAGIAAGVFYAFLPFRFTHASQVQHVWGGWLPLMLYLLLRYTEAPTWKRAGWFAAAFLMNGLTSIHALLFGSVAIAVTIAVERRRPRRLDRRRLAGGWGELVIATSLAILLLLPFLIPYLQVAKLYGMERSWEEVQRFSAMPSDWLATNTHNRLYRAFAHGSEPERWLFPGLLCLIVGAFGFRNRIAWLWIILGFIGSLGANTFFHRLLFEYVPGFRAIRVPARWAVIAYVGIAILVALGAARRPRLAPLIAIAFVIELWSAPFRWYMAQSDAPPVYRWVADTKPRAILELPIENDYAYTYMLRATEHRRPMLNGVSGFEPPEYSRLKAAATSETIPDTFIDEVRRMGADTIIVHADTMTANTLPWLKRELARQRLAFVNRFDNGIGGDWVFRLDGAASDDPRLAAFLDAKPSRNALPFGTMDYPPPGGFYADRASFVGWAMSPYGIREVNLLFNNGRICEKVNFFEDSDLQRLFPFYPATARPRWSREFDRRPPGVWENTDVQVEIVDGRGTRVRLENRFLTWRATR